MLGGLPGRTGRLEVADLRLEVPDESAEDGIGGRQRSLRQRWNGDVTNARLQERRSDGALDLVRVEVEVVTTDASEPDVEHEIRVTAGDEHLDECRLADDRCGVDLEPVEPGPPDLALLDLHRPTLGRAVELDEQRLPRPVLIEGDRFGRAWVRVGHVAGL